MSTSEYNKNDSKNRRRTEKPIERIC